LARLTLLLERIERRRVARPLYLVRSQEIRQPLRRPCFAYLL